MSRRAHDGTSTSHQTSGFQATETFNGATKSTVVVPCGVGGSNASDWVFEEGDQLGFSLVKNTTGDGHTAIGASAMSNLASSGYNNTAIGGSAGQQLTSGYNNSFVGAGAQPSSASVNNEITIGNADVTSLRIPGLSSSASTNDVLTYDGSKIVLATPSVPTIGLDDLTDAFHSGGSIGIGTDALRDEATNGFRNTAMGYRALLNHTTGDDNVALGYDSGLMLDGDHNRNTFIGAFAAMSRNSGDDNTAVGYKSQGGSSASGDNNTSLGSNALLNLQGGHSNVAIGKDAGDSINSGFQNTMIGMDAGEAITGGDNNICIGYNAQASDSNVNNEITLGDTNITSLRIPGLSSGATNGDVLTWNGTNITLAAAGGGGGDVVDDTSPQLGGNLDLNGNTIQGTGNLNVSDGTIKLDGNYPTGSSNVALGNNAGTALDGNTIANTLIGNSAGQSFTGSSSGRNTAIGHFALANTTGADENTAVGAQALQQNSGNANTALGERAGHSLTSGDNNIIIGREAQPSASTVSNEITLGDSNITVLRTNGSIMPFTDNAQDLGSTSLQWQNIYTGDLHLSNERHKEGNSVDGTTGNWTIQEGAEDLFIINNKNGKKFKFCLKEIE